MGQRFDFAFALSYRIAAAPFGIWPGNSWVEVSDHQLTVRYGRWRLRTSVGNIVRAEVTRDFAWVKTAGPPHLSLADRGVTFASNGDRALCLTFDAPVPAIDFVGRLRHPNATVTVADPEGLSRALDA